MAEKCLATWVAAVAVLLIYSAEAFELGEAVPFSAQMRGAVAKNQHNPDVAWNGQFYVVVWDDHRDDDGDIYATRISADGRVDPDSYPISKKPGEQRHPAIASCPETGDFLVVWEEEDAGVTYNRLDASGFPLDGAGVSLASRGNDVEVAASSTGYGVVWLSTPTVGRASLYGCEISGGQVGATVYFPADDANEPAVESDGERFLVLWSERDPDSKGGEIFSQTMEGGQLGTKYRLGRGRSSPARPKAAFSGDNYLVTWATETLSSPGMEFVLLSADGSPVGPVVYLPNIEVCSAAVASGDNSYVITWEEEDYGSNDDRHFVRGMRCHVTTAGTLQFSETVDLSGGSVRQQDPELCQGTNPEEFLLVWEDHGKFLPRHEDVSGEFLRVSPDELSVIGKRFGISSVTGSPPIFGLVGTSSRLGSKTAAAWRVEASASAPHLAAGIYLAEGEGGFESTLGDSVYLEGALGDPSLATSENLVACGFIDFSGGASCWISTPSLLRRHRFFGVSEGSQVKVAIDPIERGIFTFGVVSRTGDTDVQVVAIRADGALFADIKLPFSGDQLNPLVACGLDQIFMFFEQASGTGSRDLYLVRLQENQLASSGYAMLDPQPRLIAQSVTPGQSRAIAGVNEVMVAYQAGDKLFAESLLETGAMISPGAFQIGSVGSGESVGLSAWTDGVNFTFFWEESDPESGLRSFRVNRLVSPASGAYTSSSRERELVRRSPIHLAAVIPNPFSWTLVTAQSDAGQGMILESQQVVAPKRAYFSKIRVQPSFRHLEIRAQPHTVYRPMVSRDLKNWTHLPDVITDYRGFSFLQFNTSATELGDQFIRLSRDFWSNP